MWNELLTFLFQNISTIKNRLSLTKFCWLTGDWLLLLTWASVFLSTLLTRTDNILGRKYVEGATFFYQSFFKTLCCCLINMKSTCLFVIWSAFGLVVRHCFVGTKILFFQHARPRKLVLSGVRLKNESPLLLTEQGINEYVKQLIKYFVLQVGK